VLDDKKMVQAALDVVTKQDVAAFTKLAPHPVDIRGLWFDSAECEKQFSGVVLLTAAEHPAFLRCMATLAMRVEPPSSITRTWTLMYDPGVTLVLRVQDGALEGIWAPPSPVSKPAAAPLDFDILMLHLASGTQHIEVEQPTSNVVADRPKLRDFVNLSICVDPARKPDIRILSHSADDRYLHAVERAAATWTFRAFQVHGKPAAVCAQTRFGEPDGQPESFRQPPQLLVALALPYPRRDETPANVSPVSLDALRIAGSKNIVPDARTRTAISRAGFSRLVGTFKVCVTQRGRIASVTQLKSTGAYSYDRRIERGIREWRYRPMEVNGEPVPVCTAVTFIYSQK
jgi:hypothetical protein